MRTARSSDHSASCSPTLWETPSPRAVVSSVLNPGHHCLGGLCSSVAFLSGPAGMVGQVAVPAAKKRSFCLGHPVRGRSVSPREESLAGLFDRAAPAAKGTSVCATECTVQTAVSCVGREHLRAQRIGTSMRRSRKPRPASQIADVVFSMTRCKECARTVESNGPTPRACGAVSAAVTQRTSVIALRLYLIRTV